jgi:hypothetical protein
MNPELENLINMALADGKVTDKERQVIFRKAIELGISQDEIELVLDSKLYEKQKKLSKESYFSYAAKFGKVKKCPSCGEIINPLDVKCKSCGFELNITSNNKSVNDFLNTFLKLDNSKKIDFISHFSIPNNKEDFFEFLSMCIPIIEQKYSSLDKANQKIYTAWLLKSRQLVIKANSLFSDDKSFIIKIKELEIGINKRLKQIENRAKVILSIKIIFILLFVTLIILFWQKVINKKTPDEIFIETVHDKYKEQFDKFKSSTSYREYIKLVEAYFNLSYTFSDTATRNLLQKKILKLDIPSDIYFTFQGLVKDNQLCYDTALALNPNFSYAYFLKFRDLKTADDDSNKVKLLNKAILLNNKIYKFYYWRAITFMFQFSYNNALDDLNKALILKPNNIFLLAEKCRALMSMNQKIKCAHNLLLVKQHKDFIEFQSFNSDFIKGLEEFCNSKSK